MSSKKRVPSWKSSSSKKDKKEAVERTPSKLYRKIVADEVADNDNSSYAESGETSPVRLLSIKHKGYINPYILDHMPAGHLVDVGPDCGVTYQFPSEPTKGGAFPDSSCNTLNNNNRTTSGSTAVDTQQQLYCGATHELELHQHTPYTAEIMTAPPIASDNFPGETPVNGFGNHPELQTGETQRASSSLFFVDNSRESMEVTSNSSDSSSFISVERELKISNSAQCDTHLQSETIQHILNDSYSSQDTIQDKAEQIVVESVSEAKEYFKSCSHNSDEQSSSTDDPGQDDLRLDQIDLDKLSTSEDQRFDPRDLDNSCTSEGQSFTVDDIVEELERVAQENDTTAHSIPDIAQTPKKSPEKRKFKQEVVVVNDQITESSVRKKKSSKPSESSATVEAEQHASLETNQETVREDARPSAEPVVLSEEKKSEASERETTRSGTHGHLDTKIVENVSEQKDHVSRTELTQDGYRVVKEESVEAVKVIRETSVSGKEIRTSDGEFKPIFSDEPFQVLLQTRLSFGEPVFKEEESYTEAAIDVKGLEKSSKPDVVPDEDTERAIKVEVSEAVLEQPEQSIDLEVQASQSDGMPDHEEETLENHEGDDKTEDEQVDAKDTSAREKSKSPKGGLFSFFKKRSDKSHLSDESEIVPEDQKKSEKERKKEEKERKEREKRDEKQRKQREKEEKERRKKEDKEKKKGKGKESKDKDDQKKPEDNTVLSSPEIDLNQSFQSGVTLTESENHSVEEEQISPISSARKPQEIPIDFIKSSETRAPPNAESETIQLDEEGTPGQGDIIYPIETDVVVKDDRRTHTLSVSSDHREEIIQVDEPKSLTLPRMTSKNSDSDPVNETFIQVTPQRSTSQMVAPLHSPNSSFDSAIDTSNNDPTRPPGHFVVVAIDFGTTFSGYAFSFTRDPDSIHMMRKWEGGDPGVINQKTPTTLLLYPDGTLHSFGYTARDRYHDLDPQEANKWLYFDKFKMVLHHNADLNKETSIRAVNGMTMPALTIFSHALKFFKDHALQELSDQSAIKILNEDVKWVLTVPAIWKAPAKQFMRTAAYNAGIASPEYPDQLLIALEPEAASIYVRRLRMHQLVPEKPERRPLSPRADDSHIPMNMDHVQDEFRDVEFIEIEPVTPRTPKSPTSPTIYPLHSLDTVGSEVNVPGTRYMIVDCGGGTVDITVHEMDIRNGKLTELHKATGGPYGSVGVDLEFEQLLIDIFGRDFIEAFKVKRPVGWVDLMIAFESRKRAANPFKPNPLNVALPFSFIDYYKKFRGTQVDSAIKKFKDPNIRWSTQGMLRLNPPAMKRLFLPTLEKIKEAIGDVLNKPHLKDARYLFLVGGFAESPILQQDIRNEFGHLAKLIIPQDVSLAILKGAVLFGLDPTIVNVRRSRMTYGVGVLNRFIHNKHPANKLVQKDNVDWCTDIFDKFVVNDQPVALGDTVLRSYTPAKPGQKSSVINIYCTEHSDITYITDPGVRKCGTLCLDLTDVQYQQNLPKRREIQTRMIFGDTEIKMSALDVSTGKCVRAAIDFLT